VRVLSEDWQIQRDAMGVLAWQDPLLRAEAALALSHLARGLWGFAITAPN